MSRCVAGIPIPDSTMAQAALATVMATEPDILYRHSVRVFLFAALIGKHRALAYNAELLYVSALFHDIGLTSLYRDSQKRFELDSANALQAFLSCHGVPDDDVAEAARAVALHTSFGLHAEMPPLTALIGAGVETDLLGMHFDEVCQADRDEVVNAFPRGPRFKEQILETFAQGMERRPLTTFGTANADVLERCDPNYRRRNFCGLILGSNWKD
ncbi:HD domain-containing protein [Paraburkholderia kururiensis]|uniref:HD domain-containing protein n=1 Tax=Paraburkholderia kururiensis TaxID=984307 RepID=A0ABZ0WPP0_9BURK|nr:HD domain-containing protein [Paraburkholderia kururiensis]WQD79248.1 HD domain-containing protein [Paraburkholderia kururiensis]